MRAVVLVGHIPSMAGSRSHGLCVDGRQEEWVKEEEKNEEKLSDRRF